MKAEVNILIKGNNAFRMINDIVSSGPVGTWIKIHLNPNLQVYLDNHFLTKFNMGP
jgi:hypothetical protein